MLQDIEIGNHKYGCYEYCRNYTRYFGQELPNCQFNKFKIQNLIKKVHIDNDGSVTEVNFFKETSKYEDFKMAVAENQNCSKISKKNTKTSFLTKMKHFFRRK